MSYRPRDAVTGCPPQVKLDWSADPSLTVVLAAQGYPGSYAKGGAIRGLEAVSGAKVFHAGTALKDGQVVAAGAWLCSFCPLAVSLASLLGRHMLPS
jgi:phosphoribosylamine--glycine ligase